MNRRKYSARSLFVTIFISLILIVSGIPRVSAQTLDQWTADQRVPGYLDDTFTPFLLADQNRTVHAFASQWVSNGDGDRQLAIVYRKWSLMGGWTKPIDILLSPSGEARIESAFIDSSGMVHVIFWGGDSKSANIFYSHAAIENADESTAWSEPVVVGEGAIEPSSATMAGDDQGNLVVIYTGNLEGNGLYATRSRDDGRNWSEAKPIFLTYNSKLVPYSVGLYMGQTGLLHATWNVVTNTGVDESLYYARYDLAQDRWTEPLSLSQRVDMPDYFGPSFPAIVGNGQDLIIMYNNGNPFTGRLVPTGRPVQMVGLSSNNGENWKAPEVPFYQLLGRSGEHALIVDGDHVVHALFVQRIESIENGKYKILGGIWHSTFQDGFWSNPDLLLTSIAPHDVRAVVCQGNVLLVVWREDPGEGKNGIWYSYAVLGSPELPVIQPPNQVPAPVATETSVSSSEPLTASTAPVETLTGNLGNAPSASAMNPASPLIVTIVFVSVVLLGIIFVYGYRKTRNK